MSSKLFISIALLLMIAGGAFFFFKTRKAAVDSVTQGMDAEFAPPATTQDTSTSEAVSINQAPTESSYPEHTEIALATLNSVLASGNDNDPRLDLIWKALDAPTREAFIEKYRTTAPEKRNDRGTIVFLLTRGAAAPGDLDFLTEIAREKPCLSPENCAQEPGASDSEHLHTEGGMDISLNYPQLAAVFQLEEILKRPEATETMKKTAREKLRLFTEFEAPAVRDRARAVLSRYPR